MPGMKLGDTSKMKDVRGVDQVRIRIKGASYLNKKAEYDSGRIENSVGLELPFVFVNTGEKSEYPMYFRMWKDTSNGVPSDDGVSPVDLSAAEPRGNWIAAVSDEAKAPHPKTKYAYLVRESAEACGLDSAKIDELGAAAWDGSEFFIEQVVETSDINGEKVDIEWPVFTQCFVNLGEAEDSGTGTTKLIEGYDAVKDYVVAELAGAPDDGIDAVTLIQGTAVHENEVIKKHGLAVLQDTTFQADGAWTFDPATNVYKAK